MEPLDNPVWHSLTGPHAPFCDGTGLALRYDPEVSVFYALPDEPTDDAWDALRDRVGPGGVAFLPRREVHAHPAWGVAFDDGGKQWIAPANLGDHAEPERFIRLGNADVPEMLALVDRTKPGPFAKRTVELGTYLGLRDDAGELVAMAGERMHFAGYTELSAVCTDDAHRGRGLATALMHTLAAGIRERGEQPMLHAWAGNTTANALYEHLGFTLRATIRVMGLRAPA